MYLFQSATQARIVTGAALLSLLLFAPPAKRLMRTRRRRQLAAGLFVIAMLAFVLFPRHRERVSDVFILAGQSNMSGRGGVVKVPNPDGTVTAIFRPFSPEERALIGGEYDFVARLTADLEFERAKEPRARTLRQGRRKQSTGCSSLAFRRRKHVRAIGECHTPAGGVVRAIPRA